jgi:D-beta-D-heptose 7-phosphate kinase/D-beta-D-heptose 1-phosphate adenosyltransferase
MMNLIDLVATFGRRRVLVIGEAMLDSYLAGMADHLCREAPVPIVTISSRDDMPGGASNAAANVRALGGDVRLLSAIGADHAGRLLRSALVRAHVSPVDLVVSPARRTLAKQRIVADGQMLLRFDEGSSDAVDGAIERKLLRRLRRLHAWAEVILISDYGYGILTDGMIAMLAELQRSHPRPLLVDAKQLERHQSLAPTAVKPNYGEATELLGLARLGVTVDRAAQMAEHAERLLDACNARYAAVTLDSDGALLLERDVAAYRTYARPTSNDHASGAGDTFAAAFALALGAGADGAAATEIASASAAVAVGKQATATCTADELLEQLSGGPERMLELERLARRVALARSQGRRIVFTNGCFDILHRGHVAYLNRAKALGDLLIVGLNSDESVRRLKGDGRPINTLEDRAQVLGALSCVDHIVAFDDDSPVELIRALRPDVYAKGGDYRLDRLPEAPLVQELGGEVRILPFVDDRSTSGIIERIGRSYVPTFASAGASARARNEP